MMFCSNTVAPEIIPSYAADPTLAVWLESVGLNSTLLSEAEAYTMASHGDFSPRVMGTLAAFSVINDIPGDGWNVKGTDQCTKFPPKLSSRVVHVCLSNSLRTLSKRPANLLQKFPSKDTTMWGK